MSKFKKGAGSVGGIIGVIIVILVLVFGAYYFWKYKVEPRLNPPPNEKAATSTGSTTQVQITATST